MIHTLPYHVGKVRQVHTRDENESIDTYISRTLKLAQEALALEERLENKRLSREAHEAANKAVSKQAGGNYRLAKRKEKYR